MEAVNARVLEWSVAEAALEGEVSGDRHVVRLHAGGALVGVVDGLGHGAGAAAAALRAVAVLESHSPESLVTLVNQCHAALRGTRGAVMSLAAFNVHDSTMTWVGVGNVEGRLLRGDDSPQGIRESLLLRGGVVGVQLPALGAAALPVASGDVLLLASDGIRSEFDRDVVRTDVLQTIADRILVTHRRSTDDALVLVCRYLGREGRPR